MASTSARDGGWCAGVYQYLTLFIVHSVQRVAEWLVSHLAPLLLDCMRTCPRPKRATVRSKRVKGPRPQLRVLVYSVLVYWFPTCQSPSFPGEPCPSPLSKSSQTLGLREKSSKFSFFLSFYLLSFGRGDAVQQSPQYGPIHPLLLPQSHQSISPFVMNSTNRIPAHHESTAWSAPTTEWA